MLKRWRYLLPVLFVTFVAAGFSWQFWPWGGPSFDQYLDKDLTKLSDAEKYKLAAMLDKHLNTEEHVQSLDNPPSKPKWMFWSNGPLTKLGGPQPWFFWHIKTGDGKTRLVLLEQHRIWRIPSNAYATIHVFDLQGKHLNKTTFVMGYRMYFKHAQKQYDADLDADLIEIDDGALFVNIGSRRWVGIVEDRPVFLRGECEGSWLSPPYAGYEDKDGPPFMTRSIEEWQAAFQSNQATLVLEAVLWFSDDTSLSRPGLEELYPEDYARAKRIAELKQQPAIRRALLNRADSPHPWIKEAALHALKPTP